MNIQTLIDSLEFEDEAGRINAAEDLGYANAVEAVEPLLRLLRTEPSRKVRETLFSALERIDSPEVVGRVAVLLDSDDAFLRNQAVGLLQRKGEASVPVLLERMNDADPDVRKFVLDAAAGLPAATVQPIYAAALQDQDVNVRIAALEHLGEHRVVRFKPSVEEVFLKAVEPMLVCAAFATLLRIGDGASWGCIRQRYPAMRSVPGWERVWWIRALGEFGTLAEAEDFHELLRQRDPGLLRNSFDALERYQERHGRVGISEEFWSTLRGLIEAGLPAAERAQVVRLLGGFSAPESIRHFLLHLVQTGEREAKLAAIEGIKRLEEPGIAERLRDRCHLETDPEVFDALSGAERKLC